MSLAIEVPLAWLGSGSLVHDAAVVSDGGRVTYAGPRSSHPGADEVVDLRKELKGLRGAGVS